MVIVMEELKREIEYIRQMLESIKKTVDEDHRAIEMMKAFLGLRKREVKPLEETSYVG
jgi:hypothetical protein